MHYKEDIYIGNKLQKKFTRDNECIWIVYPAGAGGDLLSSIINKHFSNTCTQDYGINENGQVVIVQTDGKIINQKYDDQNNLTCNDLLIDDINKHLSKMNTDYSKLDMVLFANHAWQDNKVKKILEYFPKSKIIRIIVETAKENELVRFLKNYKQKTNSNVDYRNNNKLEHDRLLNISFSQMTKSDTFDILYDKIIQHLDLPYKLVRFDYINFWIEQQHNTIKEHFYNES